MATEFSKLKKAKEEADKNLARTEYSLECQIEKTTILWNDLRVAATGVQYEDWDEQKEYESKVKHDKSQTLLNIVEDHLNNSVKPSK